MEKRIQQEKKEGGTLFTISAYKDTAKQKFFTVWLGAWTLCGLAIISQLFTEPEENLKMMLFIFTAFWFYFEFRAIKTFRWRRNGAELIFINENEIRYGRTFNGRGVLKPFGLNRVNPVRPVEQPSDNFVSQFAGSYWVIAGEQLAFSAGNKMIYFGLRLSKKETKHLMDQINKLIKAGNTED